MKIRIAISYLIITVLSSASSYGQRADYNAANYQIEQGLSQNTINCILQDSRGIIWIGTQDGLNKYDGASFFVYRHDPLNGQSISSNHIADLCEDADGNLWISTLYGKSLYAH